MSSGNFHWTRWMVDTLDSGHVSTIQRVQWKLPLDPSHTLLLMTCLSYSCGSDKIRIDGIATLLKAWFLKKIANLNRLNTH